MFSIMTNETPELRNLPNFRTLVLNRVWQAVNIVGVKRAFALLFQDHARVVYSDTDQFQVLNREEWILFSQEQPPREREAVLKTVRFNIRIPRILLLTEFDRLPVKELKFNRQSIFERDDFTCQYCGRTFSTKGLNLDHVIPRHRGGQTSWENIVTSCLPCNTRKANRLPHEAGMRLVRMPYRPKARPFVTLSEGGEIHESWQSFLPGHVHRFQIQEAAGKGHSR
jgi:5-methylcytosine-specific restriction endonuclease McrA